MEFNENGLLEPGFHEINESEFEEIFVNAFTTSQTRQDIYDSFIKWKNKLTAQYKIQEIWVDGSFATNKINPNDIDTVVFVRAHDYMRLASDWENVRKANHIDAYLTLAICEESEKVVLPAEYWKFVNNRNYWRGQFGFDRNDSPKGVIVIKCNQQKADAQGGGKQCP